MTERVLLLFICCICFFCYCTIAAPLFLRPMPRQRADDLTLAKLNQLWKSTKINQFVCLVQVLLGEVSAGLSSTQVVVKELKASASVQDQMQFLEEVQPYR